MVRKAGLRVAGEGRGKLKLYQVKLRFASPPGFAPKFAPILLYPNLDGTILELEGLQAVS